MSKIFVIGDLHYGIKQNQSRYLDITDEVMEHAGDLCVQREVDRIVILGDYYTNRNTINVKTLNRGFNSLHKLVEKTNLDIEFISGNHDHYYRLTKKYLSIAPLSFIDPKIHIISEMKSIEIEGTRILLVPWLMPSDVETFLIEKNKGYDLCFGHFEIIGFELNVAGFINRSGLNVSDLSNFKKVFSGHFHKRQKKENVRYIGTPYQLDFGEMGDVKGFTIIHLPSLREEFIINDFSPEYKKLYFSKWEKLEEKAVRNNIVRPIVDKDAPPEEILKWENDIRSKEPKELLSFQYQLPDDEKLWTALGNISEVPNDALSMMLVFLDTIVPPEDIKMGTLRKLVRQMFEEVARMDRLTKTGNQIFIDKIEFKNFYSFGKVFQNFVPRKGINLIMGPNGSGKSALMESVVVGLFGKPVRNLNKEDVVNKINKAECVLKTTFHNNAGNNFCLERYIGKTPGHSIKLYKNNELQPQEADLRIYQNIIDKEILGINYNLFSNLQYVSLAKTKPFLAMGKPDKRSFLQELMDMQVFGAINWNTAEKLKKFEKQLAIFEREEQIYTESIGDNKERYIKLKSTYDQLREGKEERLAKLNRDIEKITHKLIQLEAKAEEKKEKILELETKKSEYIQESRGLNKEIIALSTTMKDNQSHIARLQEQNICHWCLQKITSKKKESSISKIKKETETLQKKIEKFKKDKEKYENLVENLNDGLKNPKESKANFEKKIQVLTERKKQFISQIEDLEKYSIEELQTTLKDLKESISITSKNLKDAKEKLILYRKYIRYFTYIRFLIGDDQVKKFAISKIRPWVNQIANDYLQRVGADYRIRFDENLQEEFKLRNKEIWKYGNFSGGEARRLDLVMIFTFQDILESLRGYRCDFMIFDEFLDSNLDADGRAKVMEIIRTNQKSKDLKCYIVTHSSDVSSEDFTGFYKLENKDLFSRVIEGEMIAGA